MFILPVAGNKYTLGKAFSYKGYYDLHAKAARETKGSVKAGHRLGQAIQFLPILRQFFSFMEFLIRKTPNLSKKRFSHGPNPKLDRKRQKVNTVVSKKIPAKCEDAAVLYQGVMGDFDQTFNLDKGKAKFLDELKNREVAGESRLSAQSLNQKLSEVDFFTGLNRSIKDCSSDLEKLKLFYGKCNDAVAKAKEHIGHRKNLDAVQSKDLMLDAEELEEIVMLLLARSSIGFGIFQALNEMSTEEYSSGTGPLVALLARIESALKKFQQ